MGAFFLAFIAAAVATLAARDAVRVARLSAALGGGTKLVLAIWISAIASSAVAGWFGAILAQELAPGAKRMLVALAFVLGAIEVLVLRPRPPPREPTRSFFAILVVLLAVQLTDAARLLVLGLAAASAGPWLASAGGALGSGGILTLAWALRGRWESRLPLGLLRWILAGLMLLTAFVNAAIARGVLG